MLNSVNLRWFTKTITIEQVCGTSAEDEIRVIVRGCSYFLCKKYLEIFYQLFLALYRFMEAEKPTQEKEKINTTIKM